VSKLRVGFDGQGAVSVGTRELCIVVQWKELPDLISVAVGAWLLRGGTLEELARRLLFNTPGTDRKD